VHSACRPTTRLVDSVVVPAVGDDANAFEDETRKEASVPSKVVMTCGTTSLVLTRPASSPGGG
jgi:hypothetical protein